VVAHPDALGFQDPRIKVQVKNRKGRAGGPAVRQFLGTLQGKERGLFVSTGGFTRDARHAADGAQQRVTLLDRDDFIQLLLENYESLESAFKGMVPLRKVWVPSEI
jgi:restriction system protein